MSVQIQIRRGNAIDWTNANPILAQGEIGFELDTNKIKIGNGSTAWNSLNYSGLVPADLNNYVEINKVFGTVDEIIVSASSGSITLSLSEKIATTEFVNEKFNNVNIETKTESYTLAVIDAGKVIEMNVASANDLTIPLNSSVAIPVGSTIDVIQYGEGQTTIVATSGVTTRSKEGNLKLTGQYSGATLYKRGTDEWVIVGDLTS
jgi:hypothetical protein